MSRRVAEQVEEREKMRRNGVSAECTQLTEQMHSHQVADGAQAGQTMGRSCS